MKKELPYLRIPLHRDFAIISTSEMINAIMTAKEAAPGQCAKKTCGKRECTRIAVNIRCDADMRRVLGNYASLYCGKTWIYDCAKGEWDKRWP